MLIRVSVLSAACIGIFAGESSWGQNYPVKAIRLIVIGPAGGGADVLARPIAHKVSESLGQQVVVDNRPGAAGVISGQLTANSPPDGYTILLTTASGFSIAPFLAKKLPYDPVQDFASVTLVAIAPLMAAVHPSLPVRSVRDLINLAKARPQQLLYASNGTGSISHLTTEMFSQAAGISMVHVPHKGGTPAAIDTVGGQVQLVITAVPTLLAQVRASRLRALAVTSAKRSSAVPDVPTVAESGLPGFESVQWFAIFAPKKTSTAITDKLFGEIRKAAESPSVKAPLAQEGAELAVNGPQALAEFVRTDMAKWQKVIRQSKLVLE
jgi:tripartite-type tricarboxylate transporter receptor subunit TctC